MPLSDAGPAEPPDEDLPQVARVVVVVPVHNEEALLPASLRALGRAVRELRVARPDVDVEVVVSLDGCTDQSAHVVADFPCTWVTGPHRGAAAARIAGVEAGLRGVTTSGVPLDQVWIASTDADSVVPESWLIDAVRVADQGVDMLVGPVEPVGPCDPRHLAAWQERHRPAWGDRTIHAANLGVRASSYVAVGGFAPLPEGEDVDLATRVRRTPARSVATDGDPVRTCAPTPERLRRPAHPLGA